MLQNKITYANLIHMSSSKIFLIALSVSVLVHLALFFQNFNWGFYSKQRNDQKIEISYLKDKTEAKAAQKTAPLPKDRPDFFKLPSKITADNRFPPQYPSAKKPEILSGEKSVLHADHDFAKPSMVKTDIISLKKKITLPPVEMNKINNPSYISYYQIVREKIRRAAYQNYSHTEIGEVYLTFIISSEGNLKEVIYVEDKSSKSQYLKDIALKSIKEATPFPKFPRELSYPQLSFNVIISFELE